MEAPAGFGTRLREMADTLQQRKQLFEAERQLQSVRRTTLQETKAKIEQIRRLTSSMRDKVETVSTEINRLEEKRDAGHLRLENILHETRYLAQQIIELEQEKEATSSFYEKNKEQMEMCRKKFQEENSGLEREINDLQKQYEELKRSEYNRKRQIFELDAAIAEEEEKGPQLVSMKESVIHEIASNSIKVEKLEAVLQGAVKESKKKQDELEATVTARRKEIIDLQQQNKYWENEVYKHIQERMRLQRELEILENRSAQASKALYG